MQGTVEYPITVSICLSEGSIYNQPLEIDSDGAQLFMDWLRDKKSGDVWSWQIPSEQKIIMIHRIHVVSVDIFGYIEPEYNQTKWYQRIADKWRSFLFIHKLKRR